MAIFGNTVDRCAADLRKLRDARERLESGLIDEQGRVQQLRGQLGDAELDALLEGEQPAQLREDIATLEASVSGRLAARPRLLERLREAVRALAHARAEVLRQQAAKKEKVLSDYARERTKRLEALQEFTGALWIVDEGSEGAVLHGPGGLQIHTGQRRPFDRGVRMSHEIAELKGQADALEAQATAQTKGGMIVAGTIEELLAMTAENPLAPTRAAVEAWYAETDRRAAGEWQDMYPDGMFRASAGRAVGRETPADRLTSYTLAWNADGGIDCRGSGSVNRLAPLSA
jgi:hypothetical protein